MKYKSKPTIVEATQWNGPECQVEGVHEETLNNLTLHYVITIHNKRAYIDLGDYIITEPVKDKSTNEDRHYPCKPDIFEAKYELYFHNELDQNLGCD